MMRMMKKADRKDQSTARTARVNPDTTIPIRHIRYITVSIAGIFYTGKKCLYTDFNVTRCSVAWPEVNKYYYHVECALLTFDYAFEEATL